MMKAATKPATAAALIPDGATLLIGGFMGVGSPHRMIDAIVARGTRGLTIIANDTAKPGVGIGKLISAGAVSRVIASHIGLNPETQAQMMSGALDVELSPQGSLVERIRAGGVGLGHAIWYGSQLDATWITLMLGFFIGDVSGLFFLLLLLIAFNKAIRQHGAKSS